MKELRKKCEDKLGEGFNVKLFHHLIASMGAVPLTVLEKKVDKFIEEQLLAGGFAFFCEKSS